MNTTTPRSHAALAALLSGVLLCTPAFADKGGVPNAHASPNARGSAAAGDHPAGSTTGDTSTDDHDTDRPVRTLFSGIVPAATASTSFLQFTNAGGDAGTATVTLYDGATGDEIATWTSPAIAPKASLLVDAADLAADATPALTDTQAGQALTLAVNADIHGNVQLLQMTGGVLSNISPCGPSRHTVIGGVPGPGSTSGAGVVKLTNRGDAAAHATLSLFASADGASLGTWTSPDLPAHGSLLVSTAAIAAAANPVVASDVASFTVTAEQSAVMTEVLSMPMAGGAATVLNNACGLRGFGHIGHTEDSEDSEDSDD